MSTIIALSTPIGRGAIAVVRMSGENAIDIAKQIFAPMPKKPNLLKVGTLALGEFCDQAMAVYFAKPYSYTGEDMVEFHCHGGVGVSSALIEKCISMGARMAQNGEFSKIAFLNGKQNLTNAEGIIQLIDAESKLALKAGENLLNNKLGKLTITIQNELTDIIAECEAALDYPEEDLDTPTLKALKGKLQKVLDEIQVLLDTVKVGKVIANGINIAIVGKSNVGKSSLLNALLGHERAIVSDIEGTTRDTLSESIIYKDIKFNFIDTAGIRKTNDKIEQMGIERTQKSIDEADVIINVIEKDSDEIIPTIKPTIIAHNKIDKMNIIPQGKTNELYISALYGINIDKLKEMIYNLFAIGQINQDDVILTNARHIDCLTATKQALQNAIEQINGTTLDCVMVEINNAWSTLGNITGTTASEEIINRIYEKFCLGK